MRVAALTSFGPPEVLRPMEVAEPQAGPGQVRVRVKAVGVVPFDVMVRNGNAPHSLKPPFPVIPGNEFAGEIDQVGDGVTGFAEGDAVLGFGTLGAYAEYVAAGADQVVAKPKDMPWEVAGGLPANGQGAHMALRELGVGPGDTVLISAAAGGLGTIAVQLARAWGAAAVIGTASPANHDYLRELGAIPVAYGDGLVERLRAAAPGGVDAALDAAGPDALRAAVEVAKSKDRVITMIAMETAAELGLRDWAGTRSAARLAEVVEAYERGDVRIHIRRAYPLDRAADAHRDVETRHGRGKVVLTVS